MLLQYVYKLKKQIFPQHKNDPVHEELISFLDL